MKKIVFMFLLLVACSSTVPSMKIVDMSRFDLDNRECIQQSKTVWSAPLFLAPMSEKLAQDKADSLYIECMESKGYIMKGAEDEDNRKERNSQMGRR